MLARLSSSLASLGFWDAKPNPTHNLHMSKLISHVLLQGLSESSNNIAYIEKEFKDASDVLYDLTSRKYFINRNANPLYSMECWKELFEELHGLAVNLEGRSDYSLLNAAAYINDIELAKWLVESQGVVINHGYSYSPLMVAASQGNVDFMKYLLSKGADINYKNKRDESTALHQAVRCGQVEVVEFLIQHEASLIENQDHVTAINLAEKIYETVSEKRHDRNKYTNDRIMGFGIDLPSLDSIEKISRLLKNSYETKSSIALKR